MQNSSDGSSARTFKGPRLVEVYVPAKPTPNDSDIYKDFPPGDPPIVRYLGVEANYWKVLREEQMDYLDGTKRFTKEEMDWLHGIEPEIERLLQRR